MVCGLDNKIKVGRLKVVCWNCNGFKDIMMVDIIEYYYGLDIIGLVEIKQMYGIEEIDGWVQYDCLVYIKYVRNKGKKYKNSFWELQVV